MRPARLAGRGPRRLAGRGPRRLAAVVAAAIAVSAAGGCGSGDATNRTWRVGRDAPTIAAAVRKARPGDLVLIPAGTYDEEVVVATPRIVVRGEDRNRVVLRNNGTRSFGILVTADGVAVENLTVEGFAVTGVFFNGRTEKDDSTPLTGYRVSYVTASNNGLYGIYAFQAVDGLIEHTYTSGHPDSGIYVGQCRQCRVVVADNVAERNAVGYEGTNASDDVWVVRNVFRHNRVGATPNSQQQEKLAPQGDAVLAGNLVTDNGDPEAPEQASGANGHGIAIGGGTKDRVVRNRIERNAGFGVFVTDLASFTPADAEVRDNVLTGNGTDLVYALSTGANVDQRGNCWRGNRFTSSLPEQIESVFGCDAPGAGPARVVFPKLPTSPRGPRPGTVPAPGPQPSMPDTTGPAKPATAVFVRPDLGTIVVPPPG